MNKLLAALVLGGCCAFLFSQSSPAPALLIEKPYLQLGDSPALATQESLMLLWHTDNKRANFSVEVKAKGESSWRTMATPSTQLIEAESIPAHLVYRAAMTGLKPGEEFQYRLKESGAVRFNATGKARKSAAQPFKFVLFGDCAQDTPSERTVAYRAYKENPDFLFITGDIVYSAGRISEYRSKFFPVYAAEHDSTTTGAPLLQSVPFIAAPGNHDTALNNFARFPDALAYFLYWDQPLNGPAADAPHASHTLTGTPASQAAFLEGAKPRYPKMANFSFDYGNSHWTVLDSNAYMDWTNAGLQAWLQKDLASATGATWRFVAFHHPGFNSANNHFYDQWMRRLAPVFEQGKVDVVFSGHVHNYQRTFPLTFAPGGPTGPKGEVDGNLQVDKQFRNGASTGPKGVIYIVSGAGGAALYNPELQSTPEKWQAFTQRYIADQHSFSSVSVSGRKFRLRQIGEDGRELDAFQIVK